MPGVALTWQPRAEPLVAAAVLGLGPLALALARRIQARAALAEQARVVVAPGLVCAIAPAELLPWIDGLVYLGCEAETPGLYMPTWIAPQVPASLVLRGFVMRGLTSPLALVPAPARVFSLARARPIDPEVLASWLAEQESRAREQEPRA